MALLLHRLGRFSFRRRRLVLSAWITALIAVGGLAVAANGSFSSDFTIPGTNAQKAMDLLSTRLPAANGASGRMVFAAPEGQTLTTPKAKAAITATLNAATADGARVAQATDPFATGAVSKDGRIAYSQVTFKVEKAALTEADRTHLADAEGPARAAGLQVAVGGDAAADPAAGGATEGIGVAVAVVVLAITFGSIVAAGLPLLIALLSVGLGITSIMLLSAFTDLTSSVTSLAAMLGLAVGIDYALLILSRHRAQVAGGMDLERSAAHAVGTAGSAVVFAGATVIIALVALAVTGVPFLSWIGFTAAGTVAIAVLIAITLLPALLGFAGARAVKGKTAESHRGEAKPTMGARWVAFVVRHRIPAVAVTLLATVLLAIPATGMRLGLGDDSNAAPTSSKRQAYDLLTEGFGPGFNGPLTIVVDLKGAKDGDAATTIHDQLAKLPDVAAASPVQVGPRGSDLAIISLTPSSAPSSVATENLVHAVRDRAPALRASTGADVAVTGPTAVGIDVSQRMADSLLPYLAVVVGLALVLLLIAFRSVLVPITALGGFLLTIAASFGAVVSVFQNGHLAGLFGVAQPAPVISLLPILIIGILFGLAMDYQVFLVSRMREAFTHGAGAQEAVQEGFRHSARVVTAAALIMISVFCGFILPPDPIIKSIGFALAFGVAVDAFLIRMTLIPALMSLLGARAWWLPSWMRRAVPNVDIEGAALQSNVVAHATA